MAIPKGSIRKQLVVNQEQAELWDEVFAQVGLFRMTGKELIFRLLRLWLDDSEIRQRVKEGIVRVDHFTCENCGKKVEAYAGREAATVEGWYGNGRFQWGQVGGVRVMRRVRDRCDCGHEQDVAEWPFD